MSTKLLICRSKYDPIGSQAVVMLYCRKCHRYPCKCGEYDYVQNGSEALGFCPSDGKPLGIQTDDADSAVFAPCPHCKTKWVRMPDGAFVDGSQTLGFCPSDGNPLEIQTEDVESAIFAPCPHCETEWEKIPDGAFLIFEPGRDPFEE